MIILPILSSVFNLPSRVCEFIREEVDIYRFQSDENARYHLAKDVVECLDQFAYSIDVEFLRGGYEGQKDTELQVSILFSTIHNARGIPIEQHRTFCLDFSSWQSLGRDIKNIASTYHEIYGREFGFVENDSTEFWDDIEKYCRLVAIKTEEMHDRSGRQP